jgi:hypothetical protein
MCIVSTVINLIVDNSQGKQSPNPCFIALLRCKLASERCVSTVFLGCFTVRQEVYCKEKANLNLPQGSISMTALLAIISTLKRNTAELTDQIYAEIYHAIMGMKLAPNTKLT